MQLQKERLAQTDVLSPKQDYLTQLQNLHYLFKQTEQIRELLQPLQENSALIAKDSRRLLVKQKHIPSHAGHYAIVPEITLCGKWLKDIGFEPHQHIRVITLNDLIIIYPDSETSLKSL